MSSGGRRLRFEWASRKHTFGDIEELVTNPERSVADAFKYRDRLGVDLAIEALRAWKERRTSRLIERTKAGLARARAQAKRLGRPPASQAPLPTLCAPARRSRKLPA